MKSLVFDTETTDLISNSLLPLDQQPRVIEFYGRLIEDDGKIISELDFLCNPGHPLSPTTTRITGIKTADVKREPPFSHFAKQVKELINGAEAVVAHNLSYDFDILNFEFRRCGIFDDVVWPENRICTVESTEWYNGYRLNLTALHEHLFGEPFKDAHRAKSDVEALARCFVEMRKRGDV